MHTFPRALVFCVLALAAIPARAQPAGAQRAITEPELAQWVGSLVMTGFFGQVPGDRGIESIRRQAEQGHLAGLVFYSRNIESPQQTRDLIAYIRTWSTPRALILALDQEGGSVSRLAAAKGFPRFPRAVDAAKAGDMAVYDAMAQMIADMGFDFNLAPVADLAIAPDGPAIGALGRAFGSDMPEVVRGPTLC